VAGWHAEDIVVDYFEGEEWAALDEAEADPEEELLPPPSPALSPTSPSLFA
jgi:hypothetical protein